MAWMAAVSSVVPSPFAPADLTLRKEEEGMLSYWGLERSKTVPFWVRSEAGLLGAVKAPWMVVLDAEGAVPVLHVADGAPSLPVV